MEAYIHTLIHCKMVIEVFCDWIAR